MGALADKLLSEGKLAVQDYWIRDSVDAATLLPWYSYQVMPSPFALGDISQGSGMLSVRDVEKRDIHQLVVTAARHGAVLLANDLYKHISRKVINYHMSMQRTVLTVYSSTSVLTALRSHSGFCTKPIVSTLNRRLSTYDKNLKVLLVSAAASTSSQSLALSLPIKIYRSVFKLHRLYMAELHF